MNAGIQQAPPEWPKPGSLVAPFLWSFGLVIAWAVSFVGLMVAALVLRFNSAAGAGYDNAEDVALAVSVLIQAIGGLAVLVTFIAVAWVKGQKSAVARIRFLGYGTIGLAALTVVSLLVLFLLPDGSPS